MLLFKVKPSKPLNLLSCPSFGHAHFHIWKCTVVLLSLLSKAILFCCKKIFFNKNKVKPSTQAINANPFPTQVYSFITSFPPLYSVIPISIQMCSLAHLQKSLSSSLPLPATRPLSVSLCSNFFIELSIFTVSTPLSPFSLNTTPILPKWLVLTSLLINPMITF